MSNTNQLLLKSIDRLSSSSNSSSFRLDFNEPINPGRYKVISLLFPNFINTIQTGVNDTIYFRSGSTNYTATIPQGYYTSSTIVSVIQTAMNAALAGFTVTLGTSTLCLTFANSTSFYFNWSVTTGNDCARLLGFVHKTDSGSAATSVVAPNFIDLVRVPSFYIDIAEAEHHLSTNKHNGGVLYYPVIAGISNYMVYNELNSHAQEVLFTRVVKSMNITVFDTKFATIPLNGAEWELLLKPVK